jgi:hypothetical protein
VTTVIPNPVRLTVASTSSSNKVSIKIYDDEEYLEGAVGRVKFVGLYQNGVEIGSVYSTGTTIRINNVSVLSAIYTQGYTFSLQLRTNDLPNGDYILIIRYTKNNVSKTYEVPIRIELT